MKIITIFALATVSASVSFTLLPARPTTIPNRLIDYAAFQSIVDSSGKEREKNRLTEAAFLTTMNQNGVVVLDARSANMFKLRHIKGAVNLPFTDFTAASLSLVLPSQNVKILIYCNNNFLNDQRAFTSKLAPASLNLSTFTSLKAYGYDNIFELGPLLDVNKTKIPFEGTEIK